MFLFTVDSHQKQQTIQTHIGKNTQLTEHLNQLIEQNSQLLSEIRHLQSVKFPPNPSSQIPPKMPPRYTPPNEKLGAKQGQYAPIRNEHRTRSGEWHYIHKLTPLLSYNSIWKPLNREDWIYRTEYLLPRRPIKQLPLYRIILFIDPPQIEWASQSAGSSLPRRVSQSEFGQFQPRPATLVPSLINQSNYVQNSLPRSLPIPGNLGDLSNIPLNPHGNGAYPASHEPRGAR